MLHPSRAARRILSGTEVEILESCRQQGSILRFSRSARNGFNDFLQPRSITGRALQPSARAAELAHDRGNPRKSNDLVARNLGDRASFLEGRIAVVEGVSSGPMRGPNDCPTKHPPRRRKARRRRRRAACHPLSWPPGRDEQPGSPGPDLIECNYSSSNCSVRTIT